MRACVTGPARAARGRSRRRRSPRSRRSRASCRPPAVCRLAAGAWPSCAPRSSPAACWRRCRPRRCGAGFARTPSARGSTAPGSSPARAARVLDLYAGSFEGVRLREGEYVISADEKTSVQARCRCHATLPPGKARVMRVEHEYERQGALAYLAAWDVHRARLFGRCESSTGIQPFGRLVAQVMTVEPYASAERVFWVVDNGSSHRGQASVDRLQGQWANLRLVHLPVHASWLNQIEIYFSVVQRKVVSPNDFTDLAEVERRLVGFQHRYSQAAIPFDWRYTR